MSVIYRANRNAALRLSPPFRSANAGLALQLPPKVAMLASLVRINLLHARSTNQNVITAAPQKKTRNPARTAHLKNV